MKKFAKLFEFEDIGQVLVMAVAGDDNPELQFHFQPNNLGVCIVKTSFKGEDEDAQWDAVDKAFEMVDEERAYSMIKPEFDRMGDIFQGLAQ
ncbi:Uncharacterised protein [Ectopseudomonas mendocina]|uniref:Uncharacterized protein n=1 Tax=Ectopseudomonas mendocina TaxID=300 RepID=A0A379PPT1_ECTME|nr:hypothetical protein [Pseudomonas mendocina]SUE95828.1 Uncharacterised protein [Pseudomonas mendocina]